MHPLIRPNELNERLDAVRLFDIRWDLTDGSKGRETYRSGHIPGAVFADLDLDLADPPGERGRHPLPHPARFGETLSRLGVNRDDVVVVYDDVAGQYAARMWWMLRSIGHHASALLDGGYQAWARAGLPVETGDVTPEPGDYPTPSGFSGVVYHDALAERTVIDARSGSRYRGDHEPVDPKPGHIPGAINIPTTANLDESGEFLNPEALRQVYAEVPDGSVVSCGSGVTACHDALAMILAGRAMPDVYVGSYSEWSLLDLPVNIGPKP